MISLRFLQRIVQTRERDLDIRTIGRVPNRDLHAGRVGVPVDWKVKPLLIGDVERQSGVPAKTIRYYEDVGVLGRPDRTPSGYRTYDEGVLGRLRFIRAAQSVGLTLGEIREIVALRDRGRTPCSHVTDLIQRRAVEIDERIAELERVRADLRRLARRAARLDPRDCRPDGVCHIIDR